MEQNKIHTKSLSNKQREEIYSKLFNELKSFGERLQLAGMIHADYLTKLEELIELAKKNSLTHEMTSSSQSRIAECMAECFPQIKPQLLSYWNAWSKIFTSVSPTPINIREKVDLYLKDMDEIDSMYKEIIKQNPEINDVVLYAIFYAHILKTEKIEFPLKADMDLYHEAIKNYDTDMIFSVGKKMENTGKKTGYVTHGRSLRDALSHKKFRIESHENKKYIIFANNEYGYDFTETFAVSEFLHYVQSTDMLYRLMFMMQNLMIMCTLLHESISSE